MRTVLPYHFKLIGLAIPLLVIAAVLLIANFAPEWRDNWSSEGRELGFLVLSLVNFGLLLIAVARDRVEDERKRELRLRSVSWAVLFAAGMAVINTFWVLEDGNLMNTPVEMATLMLGGHLFMYETLKRYQS